MRGGRNDHPLKLLETFLVKIMDLLNYNFAMTKDFLIRRSKDISMSRPAICKCSFVHFYQFFANWFFVSKEWLKHFQNRVKGLACKFPKNLISEVYVLRISVYEMDRSSELFFQPVKYCRLCVIALKNYLVDFIRPVFWNIMLYSKMAFGIYKSSKIYQILISWINRFGRRFNPLKLHSGNEIFFHFFRSKSCDDFFSSFNAAIFEKRNIKNALIRFLNKARNQFLGKII